jgi:AraC family transcriptional regulator
MQMLQSFRGVSVRRVIDHSDARVPEHAHDWPVLSIFVLGGYWNNTELGRKFIAGPSAILYRERAVHGNIISASGFEQIELEFDPAWLGRARLPAAPVSHWAGGHAGRELRQLAQICSRETSEVRLRRIVQQFIERADHESEREFPIWVETVIQRLRESTTLKARDLAREVQRHPSWLGAAYKRATGEGLLETAARFRVESAVRLLRETDLSSACIAAEAGFCDQSHMNRTFRRVLGRRPSAVRNDRHVMRQGRAKSTSI